MSTEFIVIAVITVTVAALGVILWVCYKHPRDQAPSDGSAYTASAGLALEKEVSQLRAELRAVRSRKSNNTFMDMADALNRIRWPSMTYDEAVLRLPVMDLALGRSVRVRLLNGKAVEFALPSGTKSGTKFRFRRGGVNGRDLHLEVMACEGQDGAK